MQRLFVGLAISDDLAQHLALLQAGVPGAHWQTRAQLHLTLSFIGEIDGVGAAAVDDALAAIKAPAFDLSPHGVGAFGGKHPHALWAGVRPSEPLLHLQRKVETALRRAGVEPDSQKFTPHITLARLTRGADTGRVIAWLTDHALFSAAPFAVAGFILYSSLLTDNGSIYRAERAYRLR